MKASFNVLTLLVGQWEGHPAYKKCCHINSKKLFWGLA